MGCEMTLTSQMMDTKVGRLHIEVDGEGPPAVLWHSLFVDSSTWSALRAVLRNDRRLIIIDGPGHGKSSAPPADFDLNDCADAAGRVIDALGVREPVDWLGNAWGGHVGLTLAASTPERLRSLATIATPVHALSRRERMSIVPMVLAYRFVGAVAPIAGGVARALLGKAFMRAQRDDAAMVIRAFRDAPRIGMHRAMTSVMLNRPSLEPLLPRIQTPTLMVVPTADQMLPVAQIHAAVAQMPSAVAVEVKGEGHVAPLIAQADELAEVIKSFWADPKGYVAKRQ
jgi:pimeloyl-ACP methyl ester carboxylesterase